MFKNVLASLTKSKKTEVTSWGIINVLGGTTHPLIEFPFEITVDQPNPETGQSEPIICCTITPAKSGTMDYQVVSQAIPCQLNGNPTTQASLKPQQDYTLHVGPHFLALRGSPNLEKWFQTVNLEKWYVRETGANKPKAGPFSLAELIERSLEETPEQLAPYETYPDGLTTGFPLQSFLEAATQDVEYQAELIEEPATQTEHEPQPTTSETPPSTAPAAHNTQANPPPPQPSPNAPPPGQPENAAAMAMLEAQFHNINTDTGELTCPICWLRFDRGDVMHIAVHESLRGDPVLGEDVPQRFFATHFNERGMALDAMNVPCTDLACPHCRRKLPFGFLDTPHFIFSIVGAPSAGKSYYLSVLIRLLQTRLYKEFGVIFKDSDPTGNALLNEMKNQLFGSTDPHRAALIKTQLEGVMYERLPRHGRFVALPKPFVFDMASRNDTTNKISLVFYDNAGEHFEPGIDTHESPGAQHVAASHGVFFLFDPTANMEFRKHLGGHSDPQLELNQRLDQQDIILSELDVRVKNLLGINPAQRIPNPLAIIIGKADVWKHLIGTDQLADPIRNGKVHHGLIEANSMRLRNFLITLCPSIVANAESISSNVRYFALSTLGHSPLRLEDGRLAPDPSRLNPMDVEAPTLWVLSQIAPQLIPPTT